MDDRLNKLVGVAQRGDEGALEEVVRGVQDQVHHLAMRMLVNPDDAMEATQEILILVVTKLSTFRAESDFSTWVYRVAVNYLLNAKKASRRDPGLNFDLFGADLENGLVVDPLPSAEDVAMLNELRISCTMAMLLCLNLEHRIAYVVGDILEIEHTEAAEILDITRDNFRKRLSRARKEVVAFTSKSCGLANTSAKCSCPRRLPVAMSLGRVRSDKMTYSLGGAPSYDEVVSQAKKVEGELKVLKLQTAAPFFKSPLDLGERITQIVRGQF